MPHELKITNPGGIYKATLEDIMNGVQTYRNPGLVNILNKLGYIDNFGSGIPRIVNAYSRSASKPEFKPTENFFTLILPNMNATIDPINRPLSDFDLTVIRTIRDNPDFNAKLLSVMLPVEPTTTLDRIKNFIKRNLNDLCEFR